MYTISWRWDNEQDAPFSILYARTIVAGNCAPLLWTSHRPFAPFAQITSTLVNFVYLFAKTNLIILWYQIFRFSWNVYWQVCCAWWAWCWWWDISRTSSELRSSMHDHTTALPTELTSSSLITGARTCMASRKQTDLVAFHKCWLVCVYISN